MTSTRADSIHYVVYQSHLDSDGSTTDAQADGYADALSVALCRAYPGRSVRVEVLRGVQGTGSGLQGEPDGVDPDLVSSLAERTEIPEPRQRARTPHGRAEGVA